MAFTVHGMDPELEVKLTQRAKREGISRNQKDAFDKVQLFESNPDN